MNGIELPDRHYAKAAIGWLELGNPAEAQAELDQLSSGVQSHPDVLELRWQICAARHEWTAALHTAQALLRVAPARVTGWIHQAYALRRVKDGGLEQARAALLPAWRQFPREDIIPFNLACYAAQLGNLEEAWTWLLEATTSLGDAEVIRRRALLDPDLSPLWTRLKQGKLAGPWLAAGE